MFRFSRYDWQDDLRWGDSEVTCRHHRFADTCDACEDEAWEDARDLQEEEFWESANDPKYWWALAQDAPTWPPRRGVA